MSTRHVHFALARHYGRKCRLVFPHGDWTQHERHIAAGWEYMAHDLPWEEARDVVLDGWHAMDFDGRDALFEVPDDDEGDEAIGSAQGRRS